MKYDGTNLKAVLEAHERWLYGPGEPDDSDRADFRDADLRGQDLSNINLYGADMRGAYLENCSLYMTMLDNVDLEGAIGFRSAHLLGAFLEHALNVPWLPLACPDTGSFVAWKKALHLRADGTPGEFVVIKLLIPEDARRLSGTDTACRADKAVVLEIQALDGTPLPEGECAVSYCRRDFVYRVGETVRSSGFDPNRYRRHARGIHFYINRYEAEIHLAWGAAPEEGTK